MITRPTTSTLFPYTTLFRSRRNGRRSTRRNCQRAGGGNRGDTLPRRGSQSSGERNRKGGAALERQDQTAFDGRASGQQEDLQIRRGASGAARHGSDLDGGVD